MHFQHRNIIVVDDDPSMNKAIQRLLNAAGFQVSAFSSAEALLGTGVACDVGCLVLDVRLPGLSGFELHHRLAELGKKLPVIFITAHEEASSRKRAESAGAIAYLTKP